MIKLKQYDHVILKDGREGAAIEIFGDGDLIMVDIGSSPEDWETIDVTIDDIAEVRPIPD